jgi:photosystem II stability/assembly factor-like uncharacterized protein
MVEKLNHKSAGILLLILVLSLTNFGQKSGIWYKENLNCINKTKSFIPVSAHFFDEKNGWVVGETGEIESKAVSIFVNGDLNKCTAKFYETPSSFDDVFFITRKHGWIAGSKVSSDKSVQAVLLESFDGGDTWKEKNLDFLANYGYAESDFDTIYFTSREVGFILGKVKDQEANLKGIILKTDDGGDNWTSTYISENDLFFEDIGFDSSGRFGWAITNQGVILNSEDSGNSWKKQETDFETPLTKIAVLSSTEVWITTQSSSLLHTLDGGKNWSIVPIKVEKKFFKGYSLWFSGIFFDDSGNGWISGSGGLILKTQNSGRSWKVESSKSADFLYEIKPAGTKLISFGKPAVLLKNNSR